MYTMMKRLTSLLLAVCMLTAFLPAGTFSASAAVNDKYLYAFAEGLCTHSANHENIPIVLTGSNKNFTTLQHYSGSSDVALWRYVKESPYSTASLVQHTGANSDAEKYGVFLFSSDGKGKTATFEIQVPEDGTYTFDVNYVDYADCRDVNVYLTPSSAATSVTDATCLLTTINTTNAANATLAQTTHPVTGVKISKGNYYVTFETATAYNSGDAAINARYFTLHSLRLTKTAEASVSAYKVAIGRSNRKILAVNETVQLTSTVWPRKKSEGYASQTVTWASSDTSVATVNESGLVTAVGNGTALITGTSLVGGSVETVSVAVGDSKSMLYAVNEDVKKYMEQNFESTTILSLNDSSPFKNTYENTMFSKWCYTTDVDNREVTAYLGNHKSNGYYSLNSKYGLFLQYTTTNNAVTFKINVEQDGNYIPEFAYFCGKNSKNANVYIYPVNHRETNKPLVSSEYFALDLKRNGGEKLFSSEGTVLPLRAGEYYVTIDSTSPSGEGSYVYLHHMALLWKTAYSNPTAVTRIELTNTDPKLPMSTGSTIVHRQLSAKVFPKNADQKVVWSAARRGGYVSVDENGQLTSSYEWKGSTVISAKVGGFEEVTSVANCELLYAFSNVGKEYLKGSSDTSVKLDIFDDYSKITTGDDWAYVGASNGVHPDVYHGHEKNDKYGVFLTFGEKDNSNWFRFKIHVPETGNYVPEVLYRDYGTKNLRMTDVYLAPVNAEDPFDTRILRVRPYSGSATTDTGVACQDGAALYLPAGDYYLTFRPTPKAENDLSDDEHDNLSARYLTLYHLALVKQDTTTAVAPKAVVITKKHTSPLSAGSTLQLSARVVPTWAPQQITWKSYNEDVATVDESGLVTAKANGVAVITATTKTDGRSESVIVQVGTDTQVYAFNEVVKKYMERNDFDNETKKNMINISTEADFTDAAYSWQNTYNVGQGWRWLGGSGSSHAYTGDSKKHDAAGDDSDPNYKYGLFLMSNSIDSFARFEIDVTQSGKYTAEVFQYMAKNNTDETQSSRRVEVYISPFGTAEEDLMHECFYVGTTVLKDGTQQTDGTFWSYGLDSQHFNAGGDNRIQLEKGKYNLVFKAADTTGRYLYLHHFALHREGDYTRPAPAQVMITKAGAVTDEVVYLDAQNPTVTLGATVLPSLANQTVTWTTSDSSIATVSNGVVTVNSTATEGTAVITATSANGVTDTVRVIVGSTGTFAYQFDFKGAVKKAFATGMTSDDSFNLFDTGFATDYELSKANGSAPWMVLKTTAATPYCNYTWSTHHGQGLFVMDSTTVGTTTQFKIKVAKDANYGVVLNISDWKKSNGFDVYLAPVTATDPLDARWRVGGHEITRRSLSYYALDLGERTLYAGEYVLSVKSTKINYVGTDDGLVSVQNLSIFRTGDAFYTIEGAQVRIAGENQFGTVEDQGLRFISTVHKSEFNVDSSEIKEFGTLLLPKQLLRDTNGDGVTDGFDLTVDSASVAKVAAKNRYVDNDDFVTFTAVLIGLQAQHYKMEVVARAYVKLANGTYVYADTWTERSIYQVAKNGLDRDAKGEIEITNETEKAALEAIVQNAK